MALQAKVPIVIATGDFKRKRLYIGYTIPYERLVNIQYEDILKEISDYINKYDITTKIPENLNPNIQ